MLRQRAYTSSVAKRKAQSAQPVKQSAPSPRRAAKKGVRTERTIVRVDPMSVFRVSIGFAFCLWIIVIVAVIFLYFIALVTGQINNLEKFLAELFAQKSFSINAFTLLLGAAFIGFVLFVAFSIIAMIYAILFNLMAGPMGGLTFTVIEGEQSTPSPKAFDQLANTTAPPRQAPPARPAPQAPQGARRPVDDRPRQPRRENPAPRPQQAPPARPSQDTF